MWMDPGKILGAGTWIPAVFDQSGPLVGVSRRIPAEMSGAGLKYCAVASLTTTNLTTNPSCMVRQIRVPVPHVNFQYVFIFFMCAILLLLKK